MKCKNLLLFALLFLGSYLTAQAQCPPNIDFETGTTNYWNYWRGKNLSGPTWSLATCPPAYSLHTIVSGTSCTDYYGGFSCVGDGYYSLKLGKDSSNQNADAADYHVHVPTGGTFSLIYRYAVVFQNPGHSSTDQPRFQIEVIDSATGSVLPCNTYSFVSSSSLPGFSLSPVSSIVWYKPWTAGTLDLTSYGGKTIIVTFRAGGCTLGGHWGYAYVDLNCGIYKIQTVGCSGGTATVTGPPGYQTYTWTDSLTYTKSYGSSQTVTISVPTVTTTYALIITPYTGYGCPDTLYARLVPSNMVPHPARDTSICYGSTVKMWGGVTDILPLTYSWSPTTGVSCTTCDTTMITPPVGINKYQITTFNTGGCLHVDTITITTYPIPATITGNQNVCLGYTSTLSNSVIGGTWKSGNTAVATIDSSTGMVTAVTLGTAKVTYSFKGLCPVYATVTVQPLPSSITGSSSVCVGYSTTLSNSSGSGTWTSGNTLVAQVGSLTGNVTGMSGGTALITFQLASTTCFVTKVMTVVPLPATILGPVAFCQGSTSSFTNTSPGGTWSASSTVVSISGTGGTATVTGVSPGTSTLTYTIGSGCYTTLTTTVLLTPQPITGTPVGCTGLTTALSDATPGGVWTTSDPTVATVSTGGLVTGIGPVTANISYTIAHPIGISCRAISTVTVNPLPNPITGGPNICLGSTIPLASTTPGGTWSSSNTSVAQFALPTSGNVTGLGLGTATITYTAGTGCITTAVVTVNPLPATIGGTKTACSGISTCLSDATPGGTWSSSTPAVATIGTSGCFIGGSSGTATITYALSSGCNTTTVVTVSPLPPAIGPSPIKLCAGTTLTLSNIVTGGTWSTSNTNSSITTGALPGTGDLTGLVGGSSTVTYTAPTGCSSTATATINAQPKLVGPTAVCVGASIILSTTVTGGGWSIASTSIAAITASTSTVATITGIAVGTTTLSYTVFLTGCVGTTTINVSPAPGPILGPSTICVGSTIPLSDAVFGGLWSNTPTTTGSIDPITGDLTGLIAGTTNITYSLGGSCTVNKTMTVLPIPNAINGTAQVCVGGSAGLSTTSTGGGWSSSNTGIAVVTGVGSTATYTGITAGTAIISFTVGSGCASTKVVTINPLPASIGIVPICMGTNITLTDASSGGTWTSTTPSVATITSLGGFLSSISPGTSTIIYKFTSTGCAISVVATVNPNPAAVSVAAPVCQGLTTTVSSSPSGGTWSTTATSIITSISSGGLVTGGTAGTATVTYTLGTGCYSTGVVTVNPLPSPISGPTAVCMGATISLSSSPSGGTWVASNTVVTIGSTSGIVTGGSGLGSSTITYTAPTTCITTTTVTVSPTPKAIAGSPAVCLGGCTGLSDIVTGGAWSAAPASVGTIDPATGLFCGISTGTAIVSYSLGGSCSVNRTMTVNPLPTPVIIGSTNLCVGQTITASDATPGGTWSSSDPTVASIGVLSGTISPGSVPLIFCDTYCRMLAVTVNPTPSAILGGGTVCEGNTITLSNSTTGGVWTSSAPGIASIGTGFGDVFGASAGSATITYTIGMCSANKNVVVNPLKPISGSTSLCVGNKMTLTNPIGGTWTSGTPAVATIGLTTGLVTAGSTGTTHITHVNLYGCTSNTDITVNPVPVPISGTGQVCKGAKTTLTDATPGGTWSASPGTIGTIDPVTGDYEGINTGTGMVTYSLGSGCTVTKVVTVNALPSIITGSSTVCAASTITVSSATPGGSWSTPTPGIISIGGGSGIVTGLTSGTATVVYTVLATGCATTKTVTVNPLPASIGGTPSMCVGNTTVLTNPASGTWSSSNTSVVTIASTGIASGISAGTSTITFTSTSTGCRTSTVATVVPLPGAITGPGAVCVGGLPITLANTTKGGIWTSDNTAIATINPTSGVLTPVNSGTVLIYYSVASGCNTFTTIIVNPISPILGSHVVCYGQTSVLKDTTLGGAWTSSNTSIATIGMSTGIAYGVSTGTATISYTTTKGCLATHAVTVNNVPLAIIGNPQICLGQTRTLSDKQPGGTWSSSNPAVADVVAGVVTGYSLGTAIISYSIASCAATMVVTVNPLPGAIAGSTNVCVGSTTTLVGSGGGIWSTSATSIATVGITSGVVTGVAAGSASIYYSLPTGCASSVTMNVLPLPSPITGPTSVCVNSTITLNSGTIGGVWTSLDPTIASVPVPATGDVLGITAGTATIVYTVPSTGCSRQVVVRVNPLPAPISGSMDLCQGSTETLSDSDPGGTWSSSTPAVATIGLTSGFTSGIAPGVTSINYTLSTGCATTSVLNVNPLPSPISGPTSVCVGHVTTLFDFTASGVWSSTNSAVATADPSNNGDIAGVAPGTSTISYTLSGTGCAATVVMTVTPPPTPIIGNKYVCLGQSYAFADLVPGGTWFSTDPTVATVGMSTGVVTGVALGSATIVYQMSAGCYEVFDVSVVPLPNVFSVTGGGKFCSGKPGVNIGLNGSNKGTEYYLYMGGKVATGPLPGTDLSLDFGKQTVGGTYTVIATNMTTGCSVTMSGSALVIVTPSVNPTVKISAPTGDTVCSGVTTAFTSMITGGGTSPVYLWDVNGTAVSTSPSYSFIPANGDVIRLTLTSNEECADPTVVSKAETLTVVKPEIPSVTLSSDPGDTICNGLNVTFTAVPVFGGSTPSYTWYVNKVLAGTGPTFTYVPANHDIIYSEMVSNYPCLVKSTVRSNNVDMTVDSAQIPYVAIKANPGTNIANGETLTLTADVTNGGPSTPSYQWFVDGKLIVGATSAAYTSNTFKDNDTVSVAVTSTGMCSMTTHEWVYIAVHPVGVKPLSANGAELSVLPNPNRGEFVVKGSLGVSTDEKVSLELTDLLGQVVYRNVVVAKGGTLNADVKVKNTLANGMYLLNVRSESATQVFHVVIEQ